MVTILAGAFGFLAAFGAHDLAAQVLHDQPLRPGAGTCPKCGTRRGWRHLKCPSCARTVSREFLLALLAGAVGIGFANTIGTKWALVAYLGFLLLTLALGVTDIDEFRIVDRLNIRGTAFLALLLAAAALADQDLDHLWRAFLAAAAYFAGTNIMFFAVRGRGFGYGDVKLSVQLGLFAGYISWGTLGWSVLITALIGGLLSVVVLAGSAVSRRRGSKTGKSSPSMRQAMKVEMPYGPAMILGCWTAIVLAGLGAFPIPS